VLLEPEVAVLQAEQVVLVLEAVSFQCLSSLVKDHVEVESFTTKVHCVEELG
jgi:hypothetical protein